MKAVFSKRIVLVKNLFWFLIKTSNIARKTKFYFFKRPEKMVFPKKSWWNLIFLVLSGKMIFLFSENIILPLDGKWKMIFLKKIHGNMIFSSNVLKRWSFQKGLLRWGMIFIVLSGNMVFFPQNMIFFPWKESERRGFPRSTWKYEIICVHVRVLQT